MRFEYSDYRRANDPCCAPKDPRATREERCSVNDCD